MSMLQLSRGQKDLLEQPLNSTEINYKSSLDTEVRPQTEGAPQAKSTVVPHELLSADSRAQTRVADVVDDQRKAFGNAFAEHTLQMLESASQTNRGPEGVFESSRLHWDMLLNRDEAIFPSDYLNFDSHYKL
ncbi:hypothetical protein WR25_07620 [Diploscapter pachys]|uniref:Uncharacterized protein n=1 Tax=Diploscapter pachys TaxID=2018661 RepID=A0A2A2J744_9BILA|nr:hypothetical protein WR25_07620 [Diploscapter pachys]